ncbi:PEP-CTERM domain protein [Methylovorus sp. MM2]|uniref:PEP-CTERM sorting domain-containing protein n=1 Tax=Methylovorus sp. MM2 TaxID=1848038 RepID=UPI0007E2928B|nr:PEP-CTERM sorting domain-containing protein [Methylovorus sp. MM2]OAM53111.1 PEP-CTERM domain protein [Methylovorus sp. MM2]
MALSTKVSALALVLGAAFSSSAFATGDVWDSASPWGSATLTDFAGWSVFNSANDTTADDAGSGIGSVTETTGTGFATGGGNIYSYMGSGTSFTINLAGTTGDVFDVYLRIATVGLLPSTTALLNNVAATSTVAFYESQGTVMGSPSGEQEAYWVWENVTGASLYTFQFSNSTPHVSLDQLQVATIAAVPEPSTYGMLALGLGVVGLFGRRKGNKKQFA